MIFSYLEQSIVFAEVLVIDSSDGDRTQAALMSFPSRANLRYFRAKEEGAASQRNEGIALASQEFVLFCDDDVLFGPECLNRLWHAITSDDRLGGVNAIITNQRYTAPGAISRTMFALLNGGYEETFAGRVLGPAVNLLPEDRDDLPEVVPVEWLNLGCTIYRREALPDPVFDSHFTGYSLMEDLTLSLRVAQRGWKLANARTARIFHDSQPGEHKSDPAARAEMELVNRHYVMTSVMDRNKLVDYLSLVEWELFQLASAFSSRQGRRQLPASLRGQWRALRRILQR